MIVPDPKLRQFIFENEHTDVHELMLRHNSFGNVPASFVAEQIQGRQKSRLRLPEFYQNAEVIYPPSLNLQQSSSSATAAYKIEFLRTAIDDFASGADLTGGFGVDTFFLSQLFNRFHYIEPDASLNELAIHNMTRLGRSNISFHQETAERFLSQSNRLSFVYVDPSRRKSGNQKVFSLHDCDPDVVVLLPEILNRCERCLIKTSPLLDIRLALTELQHVKSVIILSVDNECREVLYHCVSAYSGDALLHAINLRDTGDESFEFSLAEERKATIELSEVQKYLYEPNASILKAGAFKVLATRHGLRKLHADTHYYTSNDRLATFPGRIYEIEARVKPDKKSWRSFLPEGRANITTRNYPMTVDELKKKTGLKDGGDEYLIGFTDEKGPGLVVAARLK